jgi:hypothetical protein
MEFCVHRPFSEECIYSSLVFKHKCIAHKSWTGLKPLFCTLGFITQLVIGAKYSPTLPMTNLCCEIWLKINFVHLVLLLQLVVGAKYSPTLPMTNLCCEIWLKIFSGVSYPNHIFFYPQDSNPRPYLRDLSSVPLRLMWCILF